MANSVGFDAVLQRNLRHRYKRAFAARPTLCLIWLYLLSHSALEPAAPAHRQLLAEELSPGLNGEQQRIRLRHRLYAYHRILPPAIAQRIRLEGDVVRLEPAGTSFDVASLRRTADEWASGTGLLPQDVVTEVESAIAMCDGEYLPTWDELEEKLTESRGAAGGLIQSVRQLVQDIQVRLPLRLSHHHQARRELPRIIPWKKCLAGGRIGRMWSVVWSPPTAKPVRLIERSSSKSPTDQSSPERVERKTSSGEICGG